MIFMHQASGRHRQREMDGGACREQRIAGRRQRVVASLVRHSHAATQGEGPLTCRCLRTALSSSRPIQELQASRSFACIAAEIANHLKRQERRRACEPSKDPWGPAQVMTMRPSTRSRAWASPSLRRRPPACLDYKSPHRRTLPLCGMNAAEEKMRAERRIMPCERLASLAK